MKNKKIILVIGILLAGLLMFTGCGNEESSSESKNKTKNSNINSTNVSKSSETNTIKTTPTKKTVEVIDFSTITRDEVSTWCKTNNIKANITEEYSDTVEKGAFVSQSVVANTKIYEGDKITIVYSLGKAPTTGQKNALSSAKSYLSVMPFSYSGLIKQLEYEGYSKDEATYGADNCGADWNEQAAKSAKSYIETMSFSRKRSNRST